MQSAADPARASAQSLTVWMTADVGGHRGGRPFVAGCRARERREVILCRGGRRRRDTCHTTGDAKVAITPVAAQGSAVATAGIAMIPTGQGVPSESRSRSDPMKPIRRILASVALLATVGCHCTPGYEAYNDAVDHVADTTACFDGVYCPKLDVTRWGRWDGPCCCHKKCCH